MDLYCTTHAHTCDITALEATYLYVTYTLPHMASIPRCILPATQTHKLGLLSGLRSGLSFQWRFRKELAPGQIRALCSMRIFLFCRLPWGVFFLLRMD